MKRLMQRGLLSLTLLSWVYEFSLAFNLLTSSTPSTNASEDSSTSVANLIDGDDSTYLIGNEAELSLSVDPFVQFDMLTSQPVGTIMVIPYSQGQEDNYEFVDEADLYVLNTPMVSATNSQKSDGHCGDIDYGEFKKCDSVLSGRYVVFQSKKDDYAIYLNEIAAFATDDNYITDVSGTVQAGSPSSGSYQADYLLTTNIKRDESFSVSGLTNTCYETTHSGQGYWSIVFDSQQTVDFVVVVSSVVSSSTDNYVVELIKGISFSQCSPHLGDLSGTQIVDCSAINFTALTVQVRRTDNQALKICGLGIFGPGVVCDSSSNPLSILTVTTTTQVDQDTSSFINVEYPTGFPNSCSSEIVSFVSEINGFDISFLSFSGDQLTMSPTSSTPAQVYNLKIWYSYQNDASNQQVSTDVQLTVNAVSVAPIVNPVVPVTPVTPVVPTDPQDSNEEEEENAPDFFEPYFNEDEFVDTFIINLSDASSSAWEYKFPAPQDFNESAVLSLDVDLGMTRPFCEFHEDEQHLWFTRNSFMEQFYDQEYLVKVKIYDGTNYSQQYQLRVVILYQQADDDNDIDQNQQSDTSDTSEIDQAQNLVEKKERLETEIQNYDQSFRNQQIMERLDSEELYPYFQYVQVQGKVKVAFNKEMELPYDLVELQESISEGNLEQKMPFVALTLGNLYTDQEKLNYTYQVIEWNKQDGFVIQFIFENPSYVSSRQLLDFVYVELTDKEYFRTKSQSDGSYTVLQAGNQYLLEPWPPQISQAEYDQLSEMGESLSTGIVIAISGSFMQSYLAQGGLQSLFNLLEFMQLQTHLPLMNIQLPANAMKYYSYLFQISRFDLLPLDDFYEDIFGPVYYKAISVSFYSLGYETTLVIQNQGSFFLILMLQIVFFIIVKLIDCLCNKSKCNNCLSRYGFRWNYFIQILLSSFFLMIMTATIGTLNFRDWSNSQVIISNIYAICNFVAGFALLMTYLIQGIRYNTSMSRKSKITCMQKASIAFEGLRVEIRGKFIVLYKMIDFARSVLISYALVYLKDYYSVQICVIFAVTLTMISVVGWIKPIIGKIENAMILFNEFFMLISLYNIMIVSMIDEQHWSNVGLTLIISLSVLILVNLLYIIIPRIVFLCVRIKLWSKNRDKVKIKYLIKKSRQRRVMREQEIISQLNRQSISGGSKLRNSIIDVKPRDSKITTTMAQKPMGHNSQDPSFSSISESSSFSQSLKLEDISSSSHSNQQEDQIDVNLSESRNFDLNYDKPIPIINTQNLSNNQKKALENFNQIKTLCAQGISDQPAISRQGMLINYNDQDEYKNDQHLQQSYNYQVKSYAQQSHLIQSHHSLSNLASTQDQILLKPQNLTDLEQNQISVNQGNDLLHYQAKGQEQVDKNHDSIQQEIEVVQKQLNNDFTRTTANQVQNRTKNNQPIENNQEHASNQSQFHEKVQTMINQLNLDQDNTNAELQQHLSKNTDQSNSYPAKITPEFAQISQLLQQPQIETNTQNQGGQFSTKLYLL